MAREVARTGEDKVDTDANAQLAKDFEELRSRKTVPTQEEKQRLAEARAKAKFVKDVMKPRSAAEVGFATLPNAHDLIIPLTEEQASDVWDSDKQLRDIEAADMAANAEILKAEESEYQYFLRCRSCYGHALYFTKPVQDGQVIGDGEWMARYKPDPKTIWRQRIVCQKCLMNGHERDISIEVVDWRRGTFRCDNRWLRKVPRDRVRAAKEGSVRACEMPMTSQNVVGTIAD